MDVFRPVRVSRAIFRFNEVKPHIYRARENIVLYRRFVGFHQRNADEMSLFLTYFWPILPLFCRFWGILGRFCLFFAENDPILPYFTPILTIFTCILPAFHRDLSG